MLRGFAGTKSYCRNGQQLQLCEGRKATPFYNQFTSNNGSFFLLLSSPVTIFLLTKLFALSHLVFMSISKMVPVHLSFLFGHCRLTSWICHFLKTALMQYLQ